MGIIREHIQQVGQTTKDNESTKLQDDPFEGNNVGAGQEVQELKGDGEVGHSNQRVAYFLALENALHCPETTIVVAVALGESRCSK